MMGTPQQTVYGWKVIRRGKVGRALARVLGPAFRELNRAVRWMSFATHRAQFLVDWGLGTPRAYSDHLSELYFWKSGMSPWFIERGIHSSIGIDQGARVLDLCCGDGFLASRFYAPRARHVLAVDIDADALRFARETNGAPNVVFEQCDILRTLPAGPFDNVIWDATIQYFTPDDIRAVLTRIRESLAPQGLLSGFTICGSAPGAFAYNITTFRSAEELRQLLLQVFPHVTVYETIDRGRTSLYFYAATEPDAVPFSPGHPRFLSENAVTHPR